jgi:hypothetical protein
MPEEHPRLTIILANDGHSLRRLCGACRSNVQVDPEIGHRTNDSGEVEEVYKFGCYCGAKLELSVAELNDLERTRPPSAGVRAS